MQDYELLVLEKYQVEVKSARKTRGAFFCDTDKGLLLFKEAGISKKKAPALYRLCEELKEQGFVLVDQLIPNADGELITASQEGKSYLLKYWFQGKECDVRKSGELLAGARNLAVLHKNLKGRGYGDEVPLGAPLKEEYLRHSRELKKVRKFMRRQSFKGEFELKFLKYFDGIYQWAQAASENLERSDYEKLYEESVREGGLIHGNYNYHNLLMTARGPATTNFDKFRREVQAEDFYYFLRKAMEKHGWDARLAENMINAYSAARPLSQAEFEYIKLRLIYPEKLWKIADAYYRSNKAWTSIKNAEKLEISLAQMEKKKEFLERIFSFHL